MKLQVEITSPNAITKSGVSKAGKPYQIIEQQGMCSFPNGEVRRTSLQLEENEHDLQPGIYEPLPSAIYPGDFGSVQISMRAKNWQRVQSKQATK